MSKKPLIPAVPAVLGDHERRIRRTERAMHGPWLYFGGSADDDPPWENGWGAPGDPTLVSLRFRWLIGGGTEIQGSTSGGVYGTKCGTLPLDYRPDGEVRLPASDDAGGFIVFRILADGSVYVGVV